jgi:hypothetical protein
MRPRATQQRSTAPMWQLVDFFAALPCLSLTSTCSSGSALKRTLPVVKSSKNQATQDFVSTIKRHPAAAGASDDAGVNNLGGLRS